MGLAPRVSLDPAPASTVEERHRKLSSTVEERHRKLSRTVEERHRKLSRTVEERPFKGRVTGKATRGL